MEALKEIYVSEDSFGFLHAYTGDNHPQKCIKYIRADIAKLTWHDMKLAYHSVNAALDECDGKTMQEVMEMALIIFTEKRKDKR